MEAHADAFLAQPGCIGTCEELFEVWTAGYLQMHTKPVVLLDFDGYCTGPLGWVCGLVDRGLIRFGAVARLVVATDLTAARAAPGSAK